jgi:pectin methylesterase-like acyl-CoA thioesterase
VTAKNCPNASGPTCEPARSYFQNCYIAGNVGIIQGDGTAYFDNCEIHSTEHTPGGFITAQGRHYATQDSIFVFRNCRLTADPGVTNVALGRPWRDYASVVFLNPVLGAHISSSGWQDWSSATHRLETAFFRVYKPTGPGAAANSLALKPTELQRYSPHDVLSGKDNWNPAGTK